MSGTLHLHRHTGFRRLGFGHDLQQLHYRTLVGKPARCATRCTLTSPRPVVQQQEQMEEPQLVLPPNTSRKWRPLSNSGEWIDDVRPFRGHSQPRVEAQPTTRPIVLCPGFGNAKSDYLVPGGIVDQLQARGFRTEVLDIQRKDWANVLRSLLTRAHWTRSCDVQPGYGWFLQRIKSSLDAVRLQHGCDEVTLLAHSAGGWLARAFLADVRHFDAGEASAPGTEHNRAVAAIVTLGSPHVAAPLGTMDMTGGALTHVTNNWPGAHFAEQGVRYACIAGCTVRGNGRAHRRALSRYSYSAYMQVCGTGHMVEGDSVVPNRSAFLEGADNVLLDGVFHAPGKLGSTEKSKRPWYGSDEVLDAWAAHLL